MILDVTKNLCNTLKDPPKKRIKTNTEILLLLINFFHESQATVD